MIPQVKRIRDIRMQKQEAERALRIKIKPIKQNKQLSLWQKEENAYVNRMAKNHE